MHPSNLICWAIRICWPSENRALQLRPLPGDTILRPHGQAVNWRDKDQCVISGFHSPLEKECLSILLRGKPPIIVCLARSIENIRVPDGWRSEAKTAGGCRAQAEGDESTWSDPATRI